ncbi:hypothetical protein B0H65DRAFT_335377 [Neurospora tetraspora]|uniref:BHLH domain-containing protein n=1 Tax=Neurospora tetraspora TaxID=94610 RepID=A0AAE0MKB5_9PEZI|nr:hypothetical protein B0H65DRAFT_335377 [Neurospora tetraspora]
MPQRSLPTPLSSADMKAQEPPSLASLQMLFELPPPAIMPSNAAGTPPQTPEKRYPMQPSETVKSRRRAATVAGPSKNDFALPPPPTRSRKIIQMKPREVAAAPPLAPNSKDSTTGKSGSGLVSTTTNSESTTPAATTGGAKKKPSTAAGRKIARKTAHSLIERRRRSKMNEEFALLKSMIPACTGEMHKLAILQASIEYIRYLEDCVAKLQARHQSGPSEVESATKSLPTPSGHEPFHPEAAFTFAAREEVHDVEMSDSSGVDSPASSPPLAAITSSHQPSASPVILPQQQLRDRHDSISLAVTSTDYQRHYSFSGSSVTASPAGFGSWGHLYGGNSNMHDTRTASVSGSALTSPYLVSRNDLDHEATAALLMLNQQTQTDRRTSTTNTDGPAGAAAAAAGTVRTGRGMSVADLLSA